MFLGEDVADQKLIRHALKQFDQHDNLQHVTDNWKEQTSLTKAWTEFNKFFRKRINQKRRRGGNIA